MGLLTWEDVERTRAQLEAGRPISHVVSSLLDDQYGPCAVVRLLVDGADLPIESATALVAAGVGAADALEFRDLWNDAVARCGTSADEAFSALRDVITEHGDVTDVTVKQLDLCDAVEIIAVDRLRRMGVNDDSIHWFRSALIHAEHESQHVVLQAIDRLNCPPALVPDLLATARIADASW